MQFEDICATLKCNILYRGDEYYSAEIQNIAASDLMSEILVIDKENLLLITALTTDQVVRTADIVGAVGILLVNSKRPQESMKNLAEESGISLLSTAVDTFTACFKLGKVLEAKDNT